MIIGTTIECGASDCIHRGSDGECGCQVIEMDFQHQDNLHEYAICKEYKQKEEEK